MRVSLFVLVAIAVLIASVPFKITSEFIRPAVAVADDASAGKKL
jgi:hypothetical protein